MPSLGQIYFELTMIVTCFLISSYDFITSGHCIPTIFIIICFTKFVTFYLAFCRRKNLLNKFKICVSFLPVKTNGIAQQHNHFSPFGSIDVISFNRLVVIYFSSVSSRVISSRFLGQPVPMIID